MALMLLAILGLGLGLAVSKALLNQQQTIAQGLGILLLRESVQTDTTDTPVEIGGQSVAVDDQDTIVTVTVSIGTLEIPLEYRPRSLSIQNADIFSGDGTVRLDL